MTQNYFVYDVQNGSCFQLEEVMENETYKKAKEILERFDPERHKKLMVGSPQFYILFTLPDLDSNFQFDSHCKPNSSLRVVIFKTFHTSRSQIQIPIPTAQWYRNGIGIGIQVCECKQTANNLDNVCHKSMDYFTYSENYFCESLWLVGGKLFHILWFVGAWLEPTVYILLCRILMKCLYVHSPQKDKVSGIMK